MEKLENDFFYHIYNRGNNKQDLFLEEENYLHFLKLLKTHLLPVADVYSYCLLKNHFHILVRIKEEAVHPSKNLSNLFNAYTKALNKKYNRTGSLFQRPFKRKRLTNEDYLKQLIVYIHLNPEAHNLIDDFQDYPYSSFLSLLSAKETSLARAEVMNLFDNKSNFEFVHRNSKTINNEVLKALTFE
ncbi:transposase [Salegentibacter sp. F188]|uniref:Transposase n=1 Tax=Autumnicola patrickiae TaxID=3075591 RepID=A0ABU3E7A1_9FLAO|nr:transposase [Salegentibacter sp. F188]MDT0691514.1 transposase [Salegentibacter sp. F188]